MSVKCLHRGQSGWFPWNLPILGSGVWPGPTNCKMSDGVSDMPFALSAASYPLSAPLEQIVEWYWKVKFWTVTTDITWNTSYNPGFGPDITDDFTIAGSGTINAQNAPLLTAPFAGQMPTTGTFPYVWSGDLLVPAPGRAAPRFTFAGGFSINSSGTGIYPLITLPYTDVNSSTGTTTGTATVSWSLFGSGFPETNAGYFPCAGPPVFKQGSLWVPGFAIEIASQVASWNAGYSGNWVSCGNGTIDGVSFPLFAPPARSGYSATTASLTITRTDW